jgi:Ca2+-binding RTX toxin-like protein
MTFLARGAVATVAATLAAFLWVPLAPAASAAAPTCDGHAASIVVPKGATEADGTEGDDVIYVLAPFAKVDGLGGDDVICTADASPSSNEVHGGEGRDLLIGRGTFYGGAGDDVLRAHGGFYLYGGDGDDRIRTSGRDAHVILPGAGDDTIIGGTIAEGGDYLAPYDVAPAAGVVVDAVVGTIDSARGHDTYRGNLTVQGTNYRDVFRGSAGADRFGGFGGGDRILGRGGDDILGATQPELLDGGRGDDRLGVSFGGRVTGGPGDDVIGTQMERSLEGGDVAVERFDLSGNAGNDIFRLSVWTDEGRPDPSADPARRWRGVVAGGPGVDRLELGRETPALLRADLRTGVARFDNGRAELHSVQSLVGGWGPDVLRGDRGANTLIGGGGDDLLVGGPGRDTANGGPGRDRCRQVERRISC